MGWRQNIHIGNNNYKGGIGFCGALTIAFIILKLTNVINWSWWWVLSPLWIPIALVILFFIIVFIIVMITDK